MSSEVALSVGGLGKRYQIGARRQPYPMLRDRLMHALSWPVRRLRDRQYDGGGSMPLWALRGVSFDVRRGEVLGVIGGNGAGKSTLLKILSRITEPTEGEARVFGRVGSLLEVGTGFHPELTGRENIYLNGAILGMRRADIARRFDEIVAFAELDRFVDTPVKYYSTGMYVRLGFAVAAQMDTEILIVDEVLAVGDTRFQQKCLGTLNDVTRRGRTVLFVSHNMAAIQRLCTTAVLLDRGQVVHAGDVRSTVAAYLAGGARAGFTAEHRTGRSQVLSVDLRDIVGGTLSRPACTDTLVCHVRYVLPHLAPDTGVAVTVLTSDATPVFTTTSEDAGLELPSAAGEYEARITIPANALLAGDFHVSVSLLSSTDVVDAVDPAISMALDTGASPLYARDMQRRGVVHVPCRWTVGAADALTVA
jgi:lipopolysaccharide transport system ATP-binding protein